MQSKGAIQFFAIVLTLVCIYQLSFTWVVHNIENDAKEFADGDPLKEASYLDSMASEPVYDLFYMKSILGAGKEYTYKECKERELNLGLDLKGGMNVTLEVSVVDVIKSMANYSTDTTFARALALTRELQKESPAIVSTKPFAMYTLADYRRETGLAKHGLDEPPDGLSSCRKQTTTARVCSQSFHRC